MDYRSMKRKELQALCKEHNIPANSANSVLADKLSELLNEKQKPTSRQRTCLKNAVETTDESEPAVSRRQAKKVRFSPNNELVEYELRSGKKEKDMVTETKSRRKSVAKKIAKPVVDNINTVELTNDDVQIPVRLTRSRVQGKDDAIPINEKKQGKRAVKKDIIKEADTVKEVEGNLGKVTRSKVHTLGKDGGVQLDENKQNKRAVKEVEKGGESVVVGRVRVTRSKAQILMEDTIGPNLNPQVKKTSGRGVVNDVDSVEPSKEIMDIPVRVTRSRGLTSTDDVAKMVAVTQTEKKITKRETKGSDSSNNLRKVGPENNQQLPRRISLRTRGVEIASEDVSEKLGNGKRKKRSEESQHHADTESRHSRRNKAKVEDSTVLNPSVSKVEMVVERKVTRSKAALAMQSSQGNNKSRAKNKVQRESKMVQQLEEPLEHAGRKNVNRRKSIMQKVKGKGSEKPLVEKKEVVKEIEMVESPNIGTRKTVGKRKSKEQASNLSILDEGLEDEEKVTGSVKDATENEIKSVASVTRSHKSKKQKGNPVIEDQTIETVYVSPVDESPRRATRSASKSEGKAVPRIISGAIIKDNSSKRRAKLTESKLSDSDELAEKSNTEGSPVSKPKNLELNEKVTEIGVTPAIEESSRRLTRSAIRSERNAAVNTTPGRITRSGIKHRQNAGNKLFETVDKEKQRSHSAHQRQPLADAQMFSPEVIKNINLKKKKSPLTVQKTVLSDTMAVLSETSKEADDQILEHSVDLSVSESVRLPTKVTEEDTASMREAAIIMENVSLVSAEELSGRTPGEVMEVAGADIEKSPVQFTCSAAENETSATPHLQSSVDLPNFEDETGINLSDIKKTPFSMAEVAEIMPDVHDQNQEVYVKSATFSEAQVQIAVDLENSIVKEMESTTKRLQTDVIVEELADSIPNFDISPGVIIKGNNGDADDNSDSISLEQSYDKGKSKEMEDADQFIADDGSNDHIEKGFEQDVLTFNDPHQNPSAGKQEVADNDAHNDDDDERANDQKQSVEESVSMEEYDAEANGDDRLNQSAGEDVLQGFAMDENDIKDSLPEQNELSIGKNTNFTDDEVDDTEEVKSEEMPSTDNDLFQIPILNKSDDEDGRVNAIKECETELMPVTAGNVLQDTNGEGLNANKEREDESNSKLLNDDDDDFNMTTEVEPFSEPSNISGNGIDGECDNALKSHLNPSVGDDLVNKDDVEVDGVNVLNGVELGSEPSNVRNLPEVSVSGNGVDSECVVDEKTDGLNGESEQEPLTSNDGINVLELGSEPSNVRNFLEVSVSGNVVDSECVVDEKTDGLNEESEQEPLTSNDNPAMAEPEAVAQNENMPVEHEVLIGSSDKESEPVLNVANDEVLIGPSDKESEPVLNVANDEVLIGSSDKESEPVLNVANDEVLIGSSDKESEPVLNVANDEVLIGSSDKESEPVLNVANDEVLIGSSDIESEPVLNVANDEVLIGSSDKESEPVLNVANDEVLIGSSDKESEPVLNVANDEVLIGSSDKESEPVLNVANDEVLIGSSDKESEPVLNVANDEVIIGSSDKESEPVLNVANDEVLIGSSDKESEQVLNVANDEVLIGSSDKESEPVLNVANDEVSYDIVDVSASAGRSDSPKLATNENGITDSILDVNKDDNSKTLGDIDGVENATGIIDTENDTSFCGSEQKSKESGKFMEDCSNHGVDEENIGTPEKPTREKPTVDESDSDQFTEDIGVHGTPITEERLPITDKKEESPVNDTFSDPPTFFKDDDINKQEETQQATTCVDLGNHIFGTDEYREPDSANKCDDLSAEIMKDDLVLEVQGSARASSSMEKGFSPAAELGNSVTDLEKASTSSADGKFNQDVFMLKSNVNADVSEDYFWCDSSLKDLFKTPTTNRSSNVKHNEEDAVGFAFPDDRSCDDMELTGNRAHNFDHQWESRPFDDKTQDTATQGHFDEFSHNYFCDGSSDNMPMEKEKEKEKEKEDKPN